MRFITQCFDQCARIFPEPMRGCDIFGELNVTSDDGDAKVVVEDPAGEMNAAEQFMVQFTTFVDKENWGQSRWTSHPVDLNSSHMFHPKTRIPDALITGPWDNEALKKFFWLTRVGACFQEDQTWELAFTGLQIALEERYQPDGRGLCAMLLLERTIDELKWPDDKVEAAHRMVHRLLYKASSMWEQLVIVVFNSFLLRLEEEADNRWYAQRVAGRHIP